MVFERTHAGAGIGLGTAQFAFRPGTVEESIATVRAAVDTGVQLIDTALAYTRPGIRSYAEEIVARALRGIPTECRPIVATKGGHWRAGETFPVDARPHVLREHCAASLQALSVDRIDLYQLHHVDPRVPITDSVGALEDLRREGKIAAIGLSNVNVSQLDEALSVAPIASVQNELSYGNPRDLGTANACAERGVTYFAYMPFGGPAGKPSQVALSLAARHGASVQRVLLAWLRAQSENIIPLVGASRSTSIIDSASPMKLSSRDLAELNQ